MEEFTKGAAENLRTAVELMPTLILLVTAVGMLSASGALTAFSELAKPIISRLGFPAEALPLAVIRPISGSGAAAMFDSILSRVPPDSYEGRVCAVLMGSTETTFYTIAVYYAAVRIKAELPVFVTSLTADMAGFIFSALTVRLFY